MEHESGRQLQALPGPWLRKFIRVYLGSAERLSLFETHWGLATSVLQEASNVRLCISSQGSSSVQQRALQLVDVGSSNLQVEIQQGIPKMWETAPKGHISTLTLVDFNFTSSTLQQLQLHECKQLHTLQLKGRKQQWSWRDVTALNDQQRDALLAPNLKSFINSERICCADIKACLTAWVWLLRDKLTQLDVYPFRFSLLSMPMLTHLHMSLIDDQHMDGLILVPKLQYVTVSCVFTEKDHSSKQLQWEQLTCTGIADVKHLLRLPLRGIKRFVVHGTLRCGDLKSVIQPGTVQQFMAVCPDLLCVPSHPYGIIQRTPMFCLEGHFNAELAALCAQSLSCPAGLKFGLRSQPLDRTLPVIAQLPANITMLCFDTCKHVLQPPGFWDNVVSLLPSHFEGVVLDMFDPPQYSYTYACALLAALQASGKHQAVVITVVVHAGYGIPPIPNVLRQLAQANPRRIVLLES